MGAISFLFLFFLFFFFSFFFYNYNVYHMDPLRMKLKSPELKVSSFIKIMNIASNIERKLKFFNKD